MRSTSEIADLVRIDHFRGFESYWSVPAEAETAREGSWEPGPGDAIFTAMRDAFGNLPIVAEDLGVITPEVDGLRDRHGIPGMHVLQFDVCDPDFHLSDVAENSVCYTGTHDNDTTVGWFHGSPDDIRSETDIALAQEAVLRTTGARPKPCTSGSSRRRSPPPPGLQSHRCRTISAWARRPVSTRQGLPAATGSGVFWMQNCHRNSATMSRRW